MPGFRLRCGEERIRTSDTGLSPYNGLANRRLRPLGHLSKIQLSDEHSEDSEEHSEEEEGFEPPSTFALTVFKTVAFDHSATPPKNLGTEDHRVVIPAVRG